MQTLEAGAPVNQVVEHLTPASRYKVFLFEKDTITPLSCEGTEKVKSRFSILHFYMLF